MGAQHTPGPWHSDHPYATPEWQEIAGGEHHGPFKYASLAIGQGDKLLAEVRAQVNLSEDQVGFPQVEDIGEMRANARLIAAAPDLYEALRWFIDDIDGSHTVMVEFDANVDRARTALAKAQGRAHAADMARDEAMLERNSSRERFL